MLDTSAYLGAVLPGEIALMCSVYPKWSGWMQPAIRNAMPKGGTVQGVPYW